MSSLYCLRDYLRIPEGSTSGYGNTITRDRLGFELLSILQTTLKSNTEANLLLLIILLYFRYCGGRLNPSKSIRIHTIMR